jgi:acyl carrier protein
MRTTKDKLTFALKAHYFFEEHEVDDFANRKIEELDLDSIALLELFLVVENEFDLKSKISDRMNMNEMKEKTLKEFLSLLVTKVDEILGEQQG